MHVQYELATVVGHELRNPLGAAMNNLYLQRMALADQVEPEDLDYLDRAETQINRAAHLSQDLTAYMREREPVLGDVNLQELVAEVLDSAPPPQGIEVTVDTPVHVVADATLLGQAITNLLTNAYQAIPEGGRVQLQARADDGSTVITVTDDGPGFDSEATSEPFEPFFSTKADGTGLGLAIVARLVELHGGTVSAENLDGSGARVTVRLPHEKAPQA